MSETQTGVERPQQNEIIRYQAEAGLQGRLILFASSTDQSKALKINEQLNPVKEDDIGNTDTHDYTLFDKRSNEERQKQSNQTVNQWIESTTHKLHQDFSQRKGITPEDAQVWEQTISKIFKVNNINEITEDHVTQMYVKYLGNETIKGSNIKQFVKDVLISGVSLDRGMDSILWLSRMFGIDSADVVSQLIDAEAKIQTNKQQFVADVNPNINSLNDHEKHLLTFLDPEQKAVVKIETKTKPAASPTAQLLQIVNQGDQPPQIQDDTEAKKQSDENVNLAKKEIFEKAGKRNAEEFTKLLDEVFTTHYEQLKKGSGKMPTNIQEAEKLGIKEMICDGLVTYIPKGKGELVVVGDIHGDFATVQQIIDKKQFIENMEVGDKSMVLVFEGDYVDRGKKSVEVVETLLELKRRYPNNVVIMKADHECISGVSSHDYPAEFFSHYYTYKFPGEITKVMPVIADEITKYKDFKDLVSKGIITSDVLLEFVRKVFSNEDDYLTNYTEKLQALTKGFDPEDVRKIKAIVGGANYTLSEEVPLFKDLNNKFFELSPRLVVCGNGVVMVHGGPAGNDYDLKKFASIRDRKLIESEFDSALTWGDAVTDSEYDTATKDDSSIFTAIDDLISKAEKSPDNKVDYEDKKWHVKNLIIMRDKLNSAKSKGIWFNSSRLSEGGVLSAAWRNYLIYSQKAVEDFLHNTGGSVMIRGHQVSDEVSGGKPNSFSKNIFWTIHSTGAGSPDSYYSRRETNPTIAVFSRDVDISLIDPDKNIVKVWG